MTVTAATLPVIRALLDEANRKRFVGGVLGVSAKPEWGGPVDFDHNGVSVRVVTCQSTLAVREALLERSADRWLVVLTDRDDSELGLGITAHLTWQRLRRPDLWAAVQDRFGATRTDHRLVTDAGGRDLATGLLAATPAEGWPPVRAALLTRDHAMGAVAAARLALGTFDEQLDLTQVLQWSTHGQCATAIADLRALAGDGLVEPLLVWVAERCGNIAPAIRHLLSQGRAPDIVPLGLVARTVTATPPGSGPRALLGREAGCQLPDEVWSAWANQAETVARSLITEDSDAAAHVLAAADVMLRRVEGEAHAGESDVLRAGLATRLATLGDALRRCADRATSRAKLNGPDAPLVDTDVLGGIEEARERVESHALARHADEPRVPRAMAGVRLARWLGQPVPAADSLAALVARHRDEDAWADRAIASAWTGVDDEALAQGLRAVLGAARLRRDPHDIAFGQMLARHTDLDIAAPDGFIHLEDLLLTTVLPMAKKTPVLLVVADGMSQANATEIVEDVVRRFDSWLECVPEGRDRRLAALAVLPTLTKVSRASLFKGELGTGQATAETAGFDIVTKAHGVPARLFPKLELDSSADGYALAHNVANAVDDTGGLPLVACVLNTIDDSLDRSDPGGTAWTADTVKHLRPLLERARRAGRIVVLTSDHGHIVERRHGRHVTAAGPSSNRSRPGTGHPAGDGEVRFRGRRVLLHDGDATLAVDERLRYGPLKAGYHGGASPAEVVIPVNVLALGEPPAGWRLAPPASPNWWRGIVLPEAPAAPERPTGGPAPTLFDSIADEPPATLARAVIRSEVFRQQRDRAARVPLTDAQVERLLDALLAAPANRIDIESAAAALGVATVQLSGALPQVSRLLNVEQYPVITRDPDGVTIALDRVLLGEQFEVNT